jgi:hypothetical protein
MNELKIGFATLSNTNLLKKAQTIHHALTTPPGSTYFPGLANPSTAELLVAIDAFKIAVTSGTASSRATTRTTLTEELKRLAANLEVAAKGDLVKLAETGYDLVKRPVRSEGPTAIPQNLRVKTTGTAGEALLKCKAVKHADAYEVEHTLDPGAGPWVDAGVFTDSQRLLLMGLTRGKDYYFRVRAIAATGKSGWSDVATMMVV